MNPSPKTTAAPSKINLAEKLGRFSEHWKPKIVAELNGQMVKLVKSKGAFDLHHHEHEDEMFLVLHGSFEMQFADRPSVVLHEGEFIVIPRGLEHRPFAEHECAVMLFEPATVLNTGNVRTEKTVEVLERI